jgi:hypothetical protein
MQKRVVTVIFLFLVTLTVSAQWRFQEEDKGVPAFNATAPKAGAKLPPILGKEQLWGTNSQYPFQAHAYELASRISNVLYQQPCYCYCDRGMGHNSLRSCFEGTHGAECGTCLKELYYSYVENKKGKTAKQIRAGIVKGECKQIDLQSAASIN